MQVEIILTVNEMEDQLLVGKTAVVIDTLRATSTIVTALYYGAKLVEPKAGIVEARNRGKELKEGTYLLCGERNGIKVEGFDLGNSPLEYQPQVVSGKTVILSTTNGTKTIQRAMLAHRVLIGSLLNRSITMEEAINLGKDLVLCCSGTQGHFSLEDFVTAGAMISYLKNKGIQIQGDDRVQTAWLLYERYADDLVELMSCSQNGSRLVNIGQKADIEFCAQLDFFPLLCYFDGERVYY
ncbi:hypothetical protein BBF96_13965 [Anoxybacter fermentans]|uniref:Probable 2-phosphosulfolactate phosphatase n=1 Tax=Anoxybacter fermentans TaxID=1323375 RepID=A0A3Q9HRZ4_9FIRM|nr:2-phosphosulfolactate phosphatase [Anoxybacter fermentans]AZR74395.1 hypothetical protein BBF96_13965 [Anoxybacter fermentans]